MPPRKKKQPPPDTAPQDTELPELTPEGSVILDSLAIIAGLLGTNPNTLWIERKRYNGRCRKHREDEEAHDDCKACATARQHQAPRPDYSIPRTDGGFIEGWLPSRRQEWKDWQNNRPGRGFGGGRPPGPSGQGERAFTVTATQELSDREVAELRALVGTGKVTKQDLAALLGKRTGKKQ